ncbi:hypothetical protein QBC43DRAFT_296407 [Cladorrhinum sp. PSN259]|nr:hypothetical protein QBC43DRAFT_296407 [Cladorrhinum sp. PSN259]
MNPQWRTPNDFDIIANDMQGLALRTVDLKAGILRCMPPSAAKSGLEDLFLELREWVCNEYRAVVGPQNRTWDLLALILRRLSNIASIVSAGIPDYRTPSCPHIPGLLREASELKYTITQMWFIMNLKGYPTPTRTSMPITINCPWALFHHYPRFAGTVLCQLRFEVRRLQMSKFWHRYGLLKWMPLVRRHQYREPLVAPNTTSTPLVPSRSTGPSISPPTGPPACTAAARPLSSSLPSPQRGFPAQVIDPTLASTVYGQTQSTDFAPSDYNIRKYQQQQDQIGHPDKSSRSVPAEQKYKLLSTFASLVPRQQQGVTTTYHSFVQRHFGSHPGPNMVHQVSASASVPKTPTDSVREHLTRKRKRSTSCNAPKVRLGIDPVSGLDLFPRAVPPRLWVSTAPASAGLSTPCDARKVRLSVEPGSARQW